MPQSDKVIIYHNPRCSKSRQTLQLLEAKGIQPEIIKYLETPPNAAKLREILQKLGMEPRDLMRKKEQEYQAAGLDDNSLTHDELIQALIDHPKLIERPIVLANDKAALGRPPEDVLKIIQDN